MGMSKAEKKQLAQEYEGRWGVRGKYPSKHTRGALLSDETIIYGLPYYAGEGGVLFPSDIVVTTHRLLYVSQQKMGFGGKISEWQWRDLKNVYFQAGVIGSDIRIEPRNGAGLVIQGVEKKTGQYLVKMCQEQIRHAVDGTSETVSALGGTSRVQVVGTPQPAQAATPDPLAALKMRLVNGEITVEQFKELSELLK